MNRTRRKFTESEIQLLQEKFPDSYTIDICKLLNRSYSSVCGKAHSLGLKKSVSFQEMELQKQGERLKVIGVAARFQKGHISHNTGKKMDPEVYEKIKHTMFKKGQVCNNAKKDWEEVIRKEKNGRNYIWIKVPGIRNIMYKHRWLWVTHHGEIPKGHNIIFKDGNTMNCVLDNLECISNAELMRRNTIQRYPTELKQTMKLLKKLKRTIHEKQN